MSVLVIITHGDNLSIKYILCCNLSYLLQQVEYTFIHKNTHQLLSNFYKLSQVTFPTSRLATIGDNKALGPHLLVTFTKSRKIRPKVCACGTFFDRRALWVSEWKPFDFQGNDAMPYDVSADLSCLEIANICRSKVVYHWQPNESIQYQYTCFVASSHRSFIFDMYHYFAMKFTVHYAVHPS